jgi:hypothetical protein
MDNAESNKSTLFIHGVDREKRRMATGILTLNSVMTSGMATVYHVKPNTLRGVSFSLA